MPPQQDYQDRLTHKNDIIPSEEDSLLTSRLQSPPTSGKKRAAAIMQELDPYERVQRMSVYRRESFLVQFVESKGPPQIVILCLCLAFGFGSTIGVVPAVMTDRYARLFHGYDDTHECSSFPALADKPTECLQGSADAQNAAAIASLINNTLTFLTSSLFGSLADEYGRRGILLLGLFTSILSPILLVIIQLYPMMSPIWYYGAYSASGLISWMSVSLSSLSDVMPPKWRAPSFGLLMAGFSLGLSIAPSLALALNHFQVSVFGATMVIVGFTVTAVFFPETLPESARLEAKAARRQAMEERDALLRMQDDDGIMNDIPLTTAAPKWWLSCWRSWSRTCYTLSRPIRELSILNRSRFFRLLSCLAFFSGMGTSGDQTLLLYYLEERLAFNDQDVALIFLCIGFFGIMVQAFLLKPINDWIGERFVIVFAFSVGILVNSMYGLARTKALIYVAVCCGAFVGMSFPTISAIKANNVEESEQGRIQGALYSLQALASGVGPVVLRLVYSHTKDFPYPGPGFMFIFAAVLYAIAAACAYALPTDQANSDPRHHRQGDVTMSNPAEGDVERRDENVESKSYEPVTLPSDQDPSTTSNSSYDSLVAPSAVEQAASRSMPTTTLASTTTTSKRKRRPLRNLFGRKNNNRSNGNDFQARLLQGSQGGKTRNNSTVMISDVP